jgi:hypothetical protein
LVKKLGFLHPVRTPIHPRIFLKTINYEGKQKFMSEKHPECPLYNPLNCKEYYNPKLCAFVRKDRTCLKKKKPKSKAKEKAPAQAAEKG